MDGKATCAAGREAASKAEIPTLRAENEALRAENERLRRALNDIWNASRDEGLAKMCNWMRGRAVAALEGTDGE